jgi:nicotinamidase-related amidase
MTKKLPNWEQFALLLIDVQRDFWSKLVVKAYPDFSANTTALLTLCRSEGIEVVHLRASFKADMSDWMPKYALRGGIPCVQGTAGAEPAPFAVERPGEKVILKQTFDGFHTQELLKYLRQKGKRFLLTAGLLTSVCVLFTTVSAMQKGFLVALVEDCCADEPNAHQQTLDRYSFIFERTTVGSIVSRKTGWLAELKRLDRVKARIANRIPGEGTHA